MCSSASLIFLNRVEPWICLFGTIAVVEPCCVSLLNLEVSTKESSDTTPGFLFDLDTKQSHPSCITAFNRVVQKLHLLVAMLHASFLLMRGVASASALRKSIRPALCGELAASVRWKTRQSVMANNGPAHIASSLQGPPSRDHDVDRIGISIWPYQKQKGIA